MSLSPQAPTEPSPSPADPREDLELTASDSQTDEALPIPAGPLRSQLSLPREEPQRPSIWQRITMRKRATDPIQAATSSELAERLDAVERQLAQLDTAVREKLEALGERLEDVWQSEEQLSLLADIQEKLDRSAAFQDHVSSSLAGVRRTLGWLAALVVVAAVGAQLILSQLL